MYYNLFIVPFFRCLYQYTPSTYVDDTNYTKAFGIDFLVYYLHLRGYNYQTNKKSFFVTLILHVSTWFVRNKVIFNLYIYINIFIHSF